MSTPDQRSDSMLAASALALVWFVVTAATFYPGYLTWDSAYQWYQVRTGLWDNVHPVAMTLVWWLTDHVLPGPGGYFLLQLAMYWAGIAVLATGLFERRHARWAAITLLGFFPPVFALTPHLLKDIGLLVAMIWAVGLLAHDWRTPHRSLRVGAMVALGVACAYRHNALPAVLPFVWYVVGRSERFRTRPMRAVIALLLTGVIAGVAAVPNHLPGVAQRQVWPITAIWDLAAVSIDRREILLPDAIVDSDISLADLDDHFAAFAAVPIFGSGKIRDSVGPSAFDAAQISALQAAWVDGVIHHPGAYLQHRLRLATLLLGMDPPALPDAMIVNYMVTALADNPPVAPASNPLQTAWQTAVTGLLDSPVFAFWPYALVLIVLPAALRRRRHPLMMPVLGSAALLLAPLFVVAPGADFRFLVWPMFCSALVVGLACSPQSIAGKRP